LIQACCCVPRKLFSESVSSGESNEANSRSSVKRWWQRENEHDHPKTQTIADMDEHPGLRH